MRTMNRTKGKVWITFLACAFLVGFIPVWAEDVPEMTLSVESRKAEINWKSWSTNYEPLHIKADSDEAIVIFRFEQQPEDPTKIRVTSNAAVYIATESGFIPITERARQNPKPNINPKRRD